MQVVAFACPAGVVGDAKGDIEIAIGAAIDARGAVAFEFDDLAVLYAGGYGDADVLAVDGEYPLVGRGGVGEADLQFCLVVLAAVFGLSLSALAALCALPALTALTALPAAACRAAEEGLEEIGELAAVAGMPFTAFRTDL